MLTRMLWLPPNSRISANRQSIPKILLKEKPTTECTKNQLCEQKSVSKQIEILCDSYRMTFVDQSLRFMILVTVEDIFKKLLPRCELFPFGSFVNGFGQHGGDLDITMNVDIGGELWKGHGLCYMTKIVSEDEERIFQKSSLSSLGGVLQNFAPQFHKVRKIIHARVPIVKFFHGMTNIECDLCIDNTSATRMSELLYNVSSCDVKIQQLVFMVRHWARKHELTRSNPGPWMSNFMLTLLVLFYLQKQHCLPALQEFNNKSRLKPSTIKRISSGILFIHFNQNICVYRLF